MKNRMDSKTAYTDFEKEAFEEYAKREKREQTFLFKFIKTTLVIIVLLSLIGFAIYRAFISQFWF